ncbi:PAS domain-containing protein [Corynebacterium atypicum]|uniref:PAS domain-containing protein n=1 Tax=Corynebacterium atypicum TaxID=191610 RepID=UPI000691B166|nr:PAS domain-containing protein [Corynebacterium atypicum]
MTTPTANPVTRNDVFFSTTDDKGRITLANEVFERLSGYEHSELVGAPHNIIRHPDMPGGVFHAMWATLQSGRPFAGLVRNRNKQGGTYEVLATVTPLPGGGYLSVRTRPATATADSAWALYEKLRAQEREEERAGANRKTASEHSAETLLEFLGVEDYQHFQWDLLPAELAAHEADGARLPDAPDVTGPAREMIDSLRQAHQMLSGWSADQEKVAQMIETLKRTSAELTNAAHAGVKVKDALSRVEVSGPHRTLLLAPLEIWSNMHGIVSHYLEELAKLNRELELVSREALFMLALVRLQASAACMFAVELGHKESQKSLTILCSALEAGIDQLNEQVSSQQRLSKRVSQRIGSVTRIMAPVQEMIAGWLHDSDMRWLSGNARELVSSATNASQQMSAASARLEETTGKIVDVAKPDTALLMRLVDKVTFEVERVSRRG